MRINWNYNKVKQYIEKNNYKLLSNEYVNNRIKLKVQCPYEHEYEVSFDNFYTKNSRCPYCCGRILTYEQIKCYIEDTGSELISNEYINAHKYIKVKCRCGNIYNITWNNYKNGKRCPKCCHNRKINIQYVKNFALKCGYEIISDIYTNAYQKLIFKCSKGHEFSIPWCYFQSGTRCLYCNTSKGEEVVYKFLKENSITNIPQYTFKDCCYNKNHLLRFDFYLPKYNTCIEYDGKQHFEPVDFAGKGKEWAIKQYNECIIKDNIKNNYCNLNKINIIRIPYWKIHDINKILSKKLNL